MEIQKLDGTLYLEMLIGGAKNLANNAKIVNDLNVFPIPDGDTGTNMCMTIQGGTAIDADEDLGKTAKESANAMLMSARGNSGVILSQFFAGISLALERIKAADAMEVAEAFECGVQHAYAAVMTPTEGTILTVLREATEHAHEKTDRSTSIQQFFDYFIEEMRPSLQRTPQLLKVLADANVIDSGGAGLSYIIEGMRSVLCGEQIAEEAPLQTGKADEQIDFSGFNENSEMEFGYCTEFLLQLQRSKVDVDSFPVETVSDFLSTVGNSIVAFKTGTVIKVHVHTMTPGKVLEYCRQFGEFLTVKIENMSLQHSGATVENRFEETQEKPRKKLGIVAVASGEGLKTAFAGFGADAIVEGGQTMNPSSEDFLKAFDRVNAEEIVVLPNNGNIILAARQAAELYTKSVVHVVETKTLAEGYVAFTMLDPSSGSAETVAQQLQEAASAVTTGLVTYAVRESSLNGVSVHKNDWIGFSGKTMLCDEKTKGDAACALLEKMDMTGKEVLIGIHGKDATPEDTDQVRAFVKKKFPALEYYEQDGGQEVYSFIFALE